MDERLEVRRDHLPTTRRQTPESIALGTGEIRVRVDRFAMTSNTVTYGLVGEEVGYWRFFPTQEPWGVVPTWGFGTVTESTDPAVDAGSEVFGFLPMGGSVVMQTAGVTEGRLVDASPHRADLPSTYNGYRRVAGAADRGLDDELMLLWPLYATSFILHDWLADNDYFGAEQVVLGSASSKTAIGVAYAFIHDDAAPPLVGLTSGRNRGRLRELGLHDSIRTYDDIESLDVVPTVIVDMSGDAGVLTRLHVHLGDQMIRTSNVGWTHVDGGGERGRGYNAERSEMFFAPSQIEKRVADWGTGALQAAMSAFWRETSIRTAEWMAVEHRFGIAGIESAYHDVRTGVVPADVGIVCEMQEDER